MILSIIISLLLKLISFQVKTCNSDLRHPVWNNVINSKKLVLEQVPIKYDKTYIEKNKDILYNNVETSTEASYEKTDINPNEIINNDVQNGNFNASGNNNKYIFNEKRTAKRNDSISEKIQGYNDK